MGEIKKEIKRDLELSVYTAVGVVTSEEVQSAIRDFYEKGPITKNVLWDISEADLTGISSEEVLKITRVPRRSLELREGGKTAIVATDDLAYGMSRMYQAVPQSEPVPFVVKVFRDPEEAYDWIEGRQKKEG